MFLGNDKSKLKVNYKDSKMIDIEQILNRIFFCTRMFELLPGQLLDLEEIVVVP